MPDHSPEDQLADLIDDAPTSQSRDHMILDLAAYWLAIRLGRPLPMFAPPNNQGNPDKRATRHLPPHKVQHIMASPLSPEFYEASHGVDAIIVRDIRRRANPTRTGPETA